MVSAFPAVVSSFFWRTEAQRPHPRHMLRSITGACRGGDRQAWVWGEPARCLWVLHRWDGRRGTAGPLGGLFPGPLPSQHCAHQGGSQDLSLLLIFFPQFFVLFSFFGDDLKSSSHAVSLLFPWGKESEEKVSRVHVPVDVSLPSS